MSQGRDEEPASRLRLRPGQECGIQWAVQKEGGQLQPQVGLLRLIGLHGFVIDDTKRCVFLKARGGAIYFKHIFRFRQQPIYKMQGSENAGLSDSEYFNLK